VFLNMKPVLKPEILITKPSEKFDANGDLKDEKAKEFIKQKLEFLEGQYSLNKKIWCKFLCVFF
jgi:hypothetical protein